MFTGFPTLHINLWFSRHILSANAYRFTRWSLCIFIIQFIHSSNIISLFFIKSNKPSTAIQGNIWKQERLNVQIWDYNSLIMNLLVNCRNITFNVLPAMRRFFLLPMLLAYARSIVVVTHLGFVLTSAGQILVDLQH